MSDINIEISKNIEFEKAQSEEIIKESPNITEDNDQSFNNLLSLQLLIQKQSGIKELCK